MDFANIDNLVSSYKQEESNHDMIHERLDQFDLEKLRSIYSRVIKKRPDLLKRHHLCQEIVNAYEMWLLERKKKGPECETIELIKLTSLLILDDRSSFRTFRCSLGASIEESDCSLFNCKSKSEFYQRCAEELTYRSKIFSNITTDVSNNNLLKSGQYERLLNIYLSQLYHNYEEKYCDYLLLSIVGLNIFKYQIVKLGERSLGFGHLEGFAPSAQYSSSPRGINLLEATLTPVLNSSGSVNSNSQAQLRNDKISFDYGAVASTLIIKYDTATHRLGYFHLKLIDFDNEISSDLPKLNEETQESFQYSDNWVYIDALKYQMTLIDPKSLDYSIKEEIFSSFSKY